MIEDMIVSPQCTLYAETICNKDTLETVSGMKIRCAEDREDAEYLASRVIFNMSIEKANQILNQVRRRKEVLCL